MASGTFWKRVCIYRTIEFDLSTINLLELQSLEFILSTYAQHCDICVALWF